MKNLVVLILLQFIISYNGVLQAQWVQTNGPYGGFIYSLTVSGTNLFAGTNAGVYLSTNNGTSWVAVNNGLMTRNVMTLVVDGINIFAGTDVGVFLSTDNGSIWTAVNSGLANGFVNTLAVSSNGTGGTNPFAGTNSGVFLTTNNGSNWTQSGLANSKIITLAASSSNLFAGTDGGVFLSTNNGTTWNTINTGLPNTNVLSLAVSDTNLFVCISGYGLFRSTDNGTHWTSNLNTGILTYAFRGTTIYAGGSSVYFSTDSGQNWTRISDMNGFYYHVISSLAVSDSNIYAGTDMAGIFLSSNNGTTWTEVNSGIPANVWAIAVSPRGGTNLFAGTYSGIFRSTDNGIRWTAINSGIHLGEKVAGYAFAFDSTNIFVGTDAGVFLSTDNGLTWTGTTSGLNPTAIRTIAISDVDLFAGTNNSGIFHSTDNGASWTAVNSGLTDSTVWALAVSPNGMGSTNLFAGTDGGVFLSTNNGTSWTPAGLANNEVITFAVSGTNLFAGTNSGVFLSTNNGESWTQTGLQNTIVYSFAISGINLFAGTRANVFLSTNNGISWINTGIPIPFSYPDALVNGLTISGTNLFAGTFATGVWRRPLSEFLPVELTSFTVNISDDVIKLNWKTATEVNNMGFNVERSANKSDWTKIAFVQGNQTSTKPIAYSYVDKSVSQAGKYYYRLKQIDNDGSYKYSNIVEVDVNSPSVFALNQNYPSPFNPSTVISYRLKEKGFVKLKVYDIRGEVVRVLVNESKEAGYYETEFYGKGLASGVYIYRIEVIGEGNSSVYSDIKKTVLLK